MGILRYLFALSVLLFHSYPLFGTTIIATRLAVPSFFVISGFFITVILQTKYVGKNKSYWLFFTNRLLRIYPLYLTVFFLILGLSLMKYFFHIGAENAVSSITRYGFWATIVYLIQNITLVISPDFWVLPFKNPDYLVGPQVWALQVEIAFYAVAPFLCRLKFRHFIFVSVGILFILYTVIFPYQLIHPKSLLRLFSDHFVYFVFGIASYHIYNQYKKRIPVSVYPLFLFIGFAILFSFFFPDSSHWKLAADWVYFIVLAFVIPFIFVGVGKNNFDRFLGNLSYPLFISHIFFMKLLNNIGFLNVDKTIFTFILVVVTTASSFILYKLIDEPINIFRQKRLFVKKTK